MFWSGDYTLLKMKRGRPDRIEPPLFWFFHSEVIFSGLKVIGEYQDKKEPAIDIAGLCLPLKPQKEKVLNIFHFILF